MSETLLEVKHLKKYFNTKAGLLHAVDDVSFSIAKGETLGLVGESGCGKSTIGRAILRLHEPTSGEVLLDGTDVTKLNKQELRELRRKMQIVFQDPGSSLNPYQDVRSILSLPLKVHKVVPKNEIDDKILEILEMVELPADFMYKSPNSIGGGEKQLVSIARALCCNPKFIILDEPTSSLTAAEVEALFTIVNELRSKGVAIVYISHKMDEILRISDEVTIMRDGQYIGTWAAKDLDIDTIITKMVGRELTNLYPERHNVPGDVVFEVEDFTSINPKSFRNVSFNVRKGEILGVAGLVGAQRTELMEGLFGLRCHSKGHIRYAGKELTINQPADAIKKGIAMLTEDRRATGILGVLSIADNVSIASLNKYLVGGIMLDDKKIEKLVQDNVAKLSIKTPSSKTLIQSLSGGNQQKVLISRWLANDPDVFILDEPTRGIDVGAKYEIYCIIEELARQGKSIIMISSEMGELIGMSDRIMVMCDGRVTGFIDGDKANQENIMELATQFE